MTPSGQRYTGHDYEDHEPELEAAEKDFRRNPELVIRRGCGTDDLPVNEDYLDVLTTRIVSNRRHRTAALVNHFIRMIVEGYKLPGPTEQPLDDDSCRRPRTCPWNPPLFGLWQALSWIGHDAESKKPGRDDKIILKTIASKYQEITAVVKKSFPRLILEGNYANYLRTVVILFYSELAYRDTELLPFVHHPEISQSLS